MAEYSLFDHITFRYIPCYNLSELYIVPYFFPCIYFKTIADREWCRTKIDHFKTSLYYAFFFSDLAKEIYIFWVHKITMHCIWNTLCAHKNDNDITRYSLPWLKMKKNCIWMLMIKETLLWKWSLNDYKKQNASEISLKTVT